MNSDKQIVELQNINYSSSIGRLIFDNMNFSLRQGETALITGSTGKGKTTLIEMVAGWKSPESGSVMVFGKNIDDKKERDLCEIRKKIGGVGGIFRPISYQSVYENMKYPLLFRGEKVGQFKSKITKGLARVNLSGKKNEKVFNLSRGEKMLLMLARAIVADQPLLLIDEPLAGLDSEISNSISELLVRLSVAGHSMILLTSGQTGLEIPEALQYTIMNGRLI